MAAGAERPRRTAPALPSGGKDGEKDSLLPARAGTLRNGGIMARFFFHLRERNGRLLDEEGSEIAFEAIEAAALVAARALIAADVREGRIDLNGAVEVEDENGTLVHTRTFASAVTIEPVAPDPLIEVRLV